MFCPAAATRCSTVRPGSSRPTGHDLRDTCEDLQGGRFMADVKGHVIPVYVVVDESSSMRSRLAELNQGMASLYEALRGEPMAAAKVRLTVLGFSDGVHVRLPLCDVREHVAMPQVSIGGGTSYRAV